MTEHERGPAERFPFAGRGTAPAITTTQDGLFAPFGLLRDPFPLTGSAVSPGAAVAAQGQQDVLHALRHWWQEAAAQPLAIVTGAPGAGKTHTLLAFREIVMADADAYVAMLPDTGSRRSDAQLLRDVLSGFGAAPAGRTGLELQGEFRARLTALVEAGQRPLLLLDGANLAGAQLEILQRLLGAAPVRIVLSGAPDLADRIQRRRALATQVAVAPTLSALTRAELRQLVLGRIEAARRPGATNEFTIDEGAITALAAHTAGNPGAAVRHMHDTLREALAQSRITIDRALIEATHRVDRAAIAGTADEEGEDVVIQTRLQLPGMEGLTVAPPRRQGRTRGGAE